MIQSTRGMSRPRAATSVQSRIPVGALQNSKKVLVRFCCFCLPWKEVRKALNDAKRYSRVDPVLARQCS